MTSYAVKEGYDQALIDLVAMTPQPASDGVAYAARDYAVDGSVSEQGAYIELRWSSLASVTDYTTLLAQFGLDTATSAAVTVYVPNVLYSFTRYNGLAIRPEKGRGVQRQDYFLRNVIIVVRDLEAAA